MLPTILLLASPTGLAIIAAGGALAATAALLRSDPVPIRRDRREDRR